MPALQAAEKPSYSAVKAGFASEAGGEDQVREPYTGRSATKKYITIKWQALPSIINT